MYIYSFDNCILAFQVFSNIATSALLSLWITCCVPWILGSVCVSRHCVLWEMICRLKCCSWGSAFHDCLCGWIVVFYLFGFFRSWSTSSAFLQDFSYIQTQFGSLGPFVTQTKMLWVRMINRFHFRNAFLIWTYMLMESLHALLKIDWSQDKLLTCCIFTLLHQNYSETLAKVFGIGLPLDREKISVVLPKT